MKINSFWSPYKYDCFIPFVYPNAHLYHDKYYRVGESLVGVDGAALYKYSCVEDVSVDTGRNYEDVLVGTGRHLAYSYRRLK